MREGHGLISIWFFVGLLVFCYGLLIMATGLYELYVPPGREVVLAQYHVSVWWGALLVGIGSIYCHRYSPRRHRS